MNKEEFPKRKPNRMASYDYSSNGAYFITICTDNRKNILCKIVGEGLCALPQIELSPIGKIVDEAVKYINENYDGVTVDNYVIMPNHIHLLIFVNYEDSDKTGGHGDPPLRVYDIIGRFKSFTNNKFDGILWQRSFHDHVIRNEKDYRKIYEYISSNPSIWQEDSLYTKE